jgi:hypothetical protein
VDPKTSGTKGDKRDLQGEGNYDATHHYNEGLEKSVKKGNAEELGEKAKQALEGTEGEALREAEERAKRGPQGPAPK